MRVSGGQTKDLDPARTPTMCDVHGGFDGAIVAFQAREGLVVVVVAELEIGAVAGGSSLMGGYRQNSAPSRHYIVC